MSSVRLEWSNSGSTSNSARSSSYAASMFGETVTSCHIRVPVSSKPKYCSVSRFNKTDSRSRKRTRTCPGAVARSVNDTVSTAPLLAFLRLLLLHVDFDVDPRRHQLKLFQSLLGLLPPLSARIELHRLLVGLNRSRRKLHHFFIPYFLRGHLVHQRSPQEIPRLRVLGIEFRGLLQGLHGVAQAIGVVETDDEVAPGLGCLIGKILQVLLRRFALVRCGLLQIGLGCLFLLQEGRSRVEVRLHPCEFLLLFLLFLFGLGEFLAALPRFFNDILEIDVECRFLPALHSGLALVRLGLIREDNVDGKDAGLQVAKCVLPVTVRFRFLLGSLIAHGLHAQADPGFALNVKNLPADRSVLRCGARRKETCQRSHHYYGVRPRLLQSLHAPFSFFSWELR